MKSRRQQRIADFDGISPGLIALLKDKPVSAKTVDALRQMKPKQQIRAVAQVMAAGKYFPGYMHALLADTPRTSLLRPNRPKEIGQLKRSEIARIEREIRSLRHDFLTISASHGQEVLELVIARAYISKLLTRPAVVAYLAQRYPAILDGFRLITATERK